jgi:D-proline reductase (dithiol) PrdB
MIHASCGLHAEGQGEQLSCQAHPFLTLNALRGIYVTGQVAFHYKDDTTYRRVPTDVQSANLRTTHFAYDLTDSRRDPNVVFPIDPLRQLVKDGVIGELAEHAFTFMGGIYSARRVRDELAPQLKDCVLAQQIDVLLLVPV